MSGKNAVDDLVDVFLVHARHFQVLACQDRLLSIDDAAPIRHGKSVKAPVLSQDIFKEPSVLGAMNAIDLVVGGHDGKGMGLPDYSFERPEVDL